MYYIDTKSIWAQFAWNSVDIANYDTYIENRSKLCTLFRESGFCDSWRRVRFAEPESFELNAAKRSYDFCYNLSCDRISKRKSLTIECIHSDYEWNRIIRTELHVRTLSFYFFIGMPSLHR
ncbi:unnamed protein product [Albugo candida]|uniref:Uncharacterized protein n=1 Tax=Albugo candida TaxID=65357 RepID=A0A024G385_9STRA|nr:unnamed protein product [Albugo candida]|eukprot:CCI41126.1 unnamed protein product [Albugo candida]